MNKLLIVLVHIVFLFGFAAPLAANNEEWSLWTSFKESYVNSSGRVIDPYQGRRITTSEGQSYALFFSLVNNDKKTFDKVLSWMDKNLTTKGLKRQLPAWQYGRKRGRNQILDKNSATDSDLWIIYSLFQASRLWQEPEYRNIAKGMARQVIRKETIVLPKFGRVLLPGPEGFVKKSTVRLNPSYYPLQILEGIYNELQSDTWRQLVVSGFRVLMLSGESGIYPDWITLDKSGNLIAKTPMGYESIRNYIWDMSLHKQSHYAPKLRLNMAKAAMYFSKLGFVPEHVEPTLLSYQNHGNVGHNVSILPLAKHFQLLNVHDDILTKLAKYDFGEQNGYYSHSLALFALGFVEQRYSYDKDGYLIITWSNE